MARVRVVHASPDAPAVDVWVNGAVAFSNAPFKGITDYAALDAGTYNVQVSPTGATEPIVIDADLDLAAGTDYTVVAVGLLADIEPLVLVDNNSAPAAGKAHVRFVHASPDAPAVDIAVTGGPVLFSNVPFKGVGDYLPVDAGTYDLEARIAGTDTVALSVPGVTLNEGTVYTIFAMGLVDGDPALTAVASVDAAAPMQLPETGGSMANLWLIGLLGAGLALVAGGLMLRSRKAEIVA
jgi:LPXTG-motif cell wall-anchored protein